jgi:hypothetical protein
LRSRRHGHRFIALLIVFCACAKGPPLLRGRQLETDEMRSFLSAVERDERSRTAMSADGTITLKRSVAKLKAQMTVAVQLADGLARVRLDVSESGNVLFALASDGKRVTVLDLERRRFSATDAGPGDLAMIGLQAIDSRALAKLLLARTPCERAPSGADQTHIEWERCLGGTLLATYSRPLNGRAYLRALDLAGKFSAQLIGHTTAGIARRVEISTKDADFVAQLDDVDMAPTFDDDLFVLSPPPGVSVMTPEAQN